MMLPKYKNRRRLIVKICQECHNEYLGHIISKYCLKHRNIKDRKIKIKKVLKQQQMNRIIKHEYSDVVEKSFKCGLRNCKNVYNIKIFPRQFIYPKFCDDHRTEWKRKNFKNTRNK